MRTTIIDPCSGISGEILKRWTIFQKKNPVIQSPFFSPGFLQTVAAARNDVEVAVLEDAGEIVGLFPYERRRFDIAGPVGSFISDYHGIVSNPDFNFAPLDLLKSCKLAAWDFNHLPCAQAPLAPFFREQHRSPVIDLTAGYEAYVKERRDAGTEQIKKNGNLLRRMEREVGAVRLETHSPDRQLLGKLFQWKTAQFRQNRWRDLFSIPWVRETMVQIHATQTPDFAGVLSALYAGDKLVAMHFGMRSTTVWHYWFPAYDPAYSKYSPGAMLLLKMAEAAPAMGIKTIDLGCGEHPYKWRLMNHFVPTASGSLEAMCPVTFARRLWMPASKLLLKARHLVGRTPIGLIARRIHKV